MGIADAILSILATGLEMTESYINDPKRRLEARLKSKEKMRLKAMEIINEKNPETADKMLSDFIIAISKL
jgi:hypothetical protein